VARSQQPPRAAAGDDVALLVVADSASSEPLAPPQHVQQADDTPAAFFDVFLSYDQADWRLADALYDKLRLRGLYVHKSAARDQAPFDAARLRALRAAPTFAPVFTLSTLQRMAAAAGAAAEPDPALAECLAALYFRDVPAAAGAATWRARQPTTHRRTSFDEDRLLSSRSSVFMPDDAKRRRASSTRCWLAPRCCPRPSRRSCPHCAGAVCRMSRAMQRRSLRCRMPCRVPRRLPWTLRCAP
jgi:hypothetical protein